MSRIHKYFPGDDRDLLPLSPPPLLVRRGEKEYNGVRRAGGARERRDRYAGRFSGGGGAGGHPVPADGGGLPAHPAGQDHGGDQGTDVLPAAVRRGTLPGGGDPAGGAHPRAAGPAGEGGAGLPGELSDLHPRLPAHVP